MVNVILTPEKKLALPESLYHSAKALKAAYLKKVHPDWSEEKIKEEVKKWMMYAK